MELLILKCDSDYFRVKGNTFFKVKLDKASVFPMDQMDKVKAYQSLLRQEGFSTACIKKLVLTEEDLSS